VTFSDTTGRRLPRRTATLLAVAFGCAAVSATAQAQSSADTGTPGRRVGSEANQPGAATLSGHVQDEAGKPVAQAVVTLGGDSALTGDDGQFLLHASPGAYLLIVRRLGFRVERFAVSLAAGEPREVTVVATRFVPVLPTVTTTAQERAAYRAVGFEQRMKAGIGQFLTYEQIQQRHATRLSQLLDRMRGIEVHIAPKSYDYTVEGTRGPGSCVGYVVDGVPQTQLPPTPQHPANGPDFLMDPSAVGAIEVYSSAERPVEFGPGLHEQAPPVSGMPAPAIDLGGQQCALVVIWTRARLGLTGSPTGLSASNAPGSTAAQSATAVPDIARGVPVFANDASCHAPAPADTVDLVVYATVEAARPERIPDSAWSSYKAGVLNALDRSATLPTELFLPVFGIPFAAAGKADGESSRDLRVAPTLSNVIQFTLDSGGALMSTHVAASSLSASADTMALAIVEGAGATHAFPRLPVAAGGQDSAQLLLLVASIEPTVGTRASVIGQLEVPSWHLTRAVRLAATDQSRTGEDSRGQPLERDITIEAVISDAGRVIPSTLRVVGGLDGASWASLLNRALALQFEPALIGSCPVPELILQPLTSR
jgi:Carboxypeptidase regulatory-like domain/TonB-dependent Receptor Plug Domain